MHQQSHDLEFHIESLRKVNAKDKGFQIFNKLFTRKTLWLRARVKGVCSLMVGKTAGARRR